jgi:serine/threonine protein kinase
VAHHDVKPGNILIDASKGGKLLLADFGTSVKPGEECTGFTMSYAPPELLASYELDDFSHLR